MIDVLKFDIEGSEWERLRVMAVDGSLANVKQLMLEFHTPEVTASKSDFVEMHGLLSSLEKSGFRRYHQHQNPNCIYTSTRTGKQYAHCYELYYINTRYLL